MNRFRRREQQAKSNTFLSFVPIILMMLFIISGATYQLPVLHPYFKPVLLFDGIVIICCIAWYFLSIFRRNRHVQNTSMHHIDRMSGTEFERFLKSYYEREGYRATTFGGSGDGGADLILEKHGKRVVVQAKRYSKTIPYSAVQQVFTAKALYKCDEAWIVCNRHLSRQGVDASKELGVKIIGRRTLEDMLQNVKR